MSEDYAPATKTPEVLSSLTELKIKYATAKYYSENYDEYGIKFEAEGFIITNYYGTYENCVAIMTEDKYFGGAAVAQTVSVAGVNIFYSTIPLIPICIWRYTK